MLPKIHGILLCFYIVFAKASAFEIQEGDILLQPLHCRVCTLIEEQNNSPYSHIGIVIKEGEELKVFEAWQKVEFVSLEKYLAKTEKGLKIKVVRHKFLNHSELKNLSTLAKLYDGLPYDRNYRWGDEAIYCSELVYKLLQDLTAYLPPLQIMPFDINPLEWDRHFRGDTPRGELGIAPSHFDNELYFKTIGEL